MHTIRVSTHEQWRQTHKKETATYCFVENHFIIGIVIAIVITISVCHCLCWVVLLLFSSEAYQKKIDALKCFQHATHMFVNRASISFRGISESSSLEECFKHLFGILFAFVWFLCDCGAGTYIMDLSNSVYLWLLSEALSVFCVRDCIFVCWCVFSKSNRNKWHYFDSIWKFWWGLMR